MYRKIAPIMQPIICWRSSVIRGPNPRPQERQMSILKIVHWLFGDNKMQECAAAFPVESSARSTAPTDRDILAAFEPWTLACAVGAENGTVGTSMGFEMWFQCSRKNWLPKVRGFVNASDTRIKSVLQTFVSANVHKDYRAVLREEEAKRGIRPSCVLGPGESMTVTVPLKIGEETTFSSADLEAARRKHQP